MKPCCESQIFIILHNHGRYIQTKQHNQTVMQLSYDSNVLLPFHYFRKASYCKSKEKMEGTKIGQETML